MRRLSHAAVLPLLIGVWVSAHASYAAPYDRADTLAAIEQAAVDTGVPYALLYRIVACETGHTFDPRSEGDSGHSHGAAQLNDYGNALPIFYRHYSDPYNPYEAIYFMAESLRGDHAPLGRWTWNCG